MAGSSFTASGTRPEAGCQIRRRLKYPGVFAKEERGTKTVAFIFSGGLIVAADHSSKSSVPNIFKLNSHMFATSSGKSLTLVEELLRKWPINGGGMSVTETSKWVHDNLSVSQIFGRRDSDRRNKRNCSGNPLRFQICSTGSGAMSARVHAELRMRFDMTLTEAAEIAKSAICSAASKAAEGGDLVSVYHVGRLGWRKLISDYQIGEWQKQNKDILLQQPITVSIYPPWD
ncbi:OLC1v1007551C1 [Oldenlandia corymbosa var. corymbosa]|uniref:OLC1v1007551C1 n=1 Tax=Oldenlandia corymbosa var. corymbosa TaxID=529605 RepID=A0AAV1DJJ5_OLDCO|nr:OLC1v1007551C1 [Oldenlandia corymbosa var. corymbosa]